MVCLLGRSQFYLDQTARALESHARILERSLPSNPAAVDGFLQAGREARGHAHHGHRAVGQGHRRFGRDPAIMENHADRPEIQEAFAGGYGKLSPQEPDARLPDDVRGDPLAERRGNRVLRASLSLSHIDQTIRELQARIALAGVAIVIAAAMICLIVSGRVARPIEEMRRGVERLAGGRVRKPDPRSRLPRSWAAWRRSSTRWRRRRRTASG